MDLGARHLWALGAMGLAAAALAFAIVLQALPALGVGRPDPGAQVRQGADLLAEASGEEDFRAIEALAREALDRAPLEAQAVSLLAIARQGRGRPAEVRRLMGAAAGLSRRDVLANLWLFDEAMRERRYEQAFIYADAVLRRDLDGNQPLLQVLVASGADPAALGPLAARLAGQPRWRESFFSLAIAQPYAYGLFEAMQEAGDPPKAEEISLYLHRLTRAGAYEQAYLAWLLSLSSDELTDAGYLYDGAFSGRRTLAPFGWTFQTGAGGGAGIETADGESALFTHADGFAASEVAAQLVVLPPGRYRFSGRARAADRGAEGRLAWTLKCPGGQTLFETPSAPTGGQWRRFSQPFAVPEGCTGQTLTLTSALSDRRIPVSVWYDDLAIEAAESAEGGA